jgi:plasmid rolling circle replication initiator protein Rep
MLNNKPKNQKNQEAPALDDPTSTGRKRPWRDKKMRSLTVANSFHRLGDLKREGRIRQCGTYLEFKKEIDTGRRFLSAANFCRERLCPMCQWRRSLKVFFQVSRAMDIAEADHKNLVPLFLTLTLRNCKAAIPETAKTLNQIFEGWHNLFDIRKIKATLPGWFRALELTYNKKTDTFHPHIHAILLVDKSYFKTGYIETAEWVQLWRGAMRLDYDPICDIRKIKNGKGKRKGIAEVSKYTVKDAEIATGDNARTDHLVNVLGQTLKGRRLYAFGGLLKQIQAGFSVTAPDDGDLTNTSGETIRQDVATVLERYRWNFGIGQYQRILS